MQDCYSCKYHVLPHCRRHAPRPDKAGLPVFPFIPDMPWCGDYESKEKAKEEFQTQYMCKPFTDGSNSAYNQYDAAESRTNQSKLNLRRFRT